MKETKVTIVIKNVSELKTTMEYIKEVCEKYNHTPLFYEIIIGR